MPSHATGIRHHQLQQQTQFKTSNKDPYLGFVDSCNWGYIGYDYTYTDLHLHPLTYIYPWTSKHLQGLRVRLQAKPRTRSLIGPEP